MLLRSEKMDVVWSEFKTMRKKKKKVLTEGAEKRQWNKVEILFKKGLSEDDIINHIHSVCDSLWDNIYSNEEHLNNILSKYLKTNGKKITNNSKGSNYYTYHKGTAYEQVAEGLYSATKEYNFIERVKA